MIHQHGAETSLQDGPVDRADLPTHDIGSWCSLMKVLLHSMILTNAVLTRPGRRRADSSGSESDSDSDTDDSSPRRIRSRKHYNKDLPVARAGPIYTSPRHRSRSMGAPRPRSQGPPGPPRHYDSDSDSSSDDDSRKKSPPKPAPKQLLYTGLACVATVAAANNIYQSAKAHHTRQKELEEGEISSAEAQKLKMQARKMDLISLGVAAVGAYNVRNGWRRAEGHVSALSISVLHLSQPLSDLKKCLCRDKSVLASHTHLHA